MNFKTSLLIETAWVLVEVALTLAALFGSPILEKSPPNAAAAIACENCE
jgi:hypothetical protein